MYNPTQISEMNKCKQQTVNDNLTERKNHHGSVQQERPHGNWNTENSRKHKVNCFSNSIETEMSDENVETNLKLHTPLNNTLKDASSKTFNSIETPLHEYAPEFVNDLNPFESAVAATSNKVYKTMLAKYSDKTKKPHKSDTTLKTHYNHNSLSEFSSKSSSKSSSHHNSKNKSHDKKERCDKHSVSEKHIKADKSKIKITSQHVKENYYKVKMDNKNIENNKDVAKSNHEPFFFDNIFSSEYKYISEEHQQPFEKIQAKTEVKVSSSEDVSAASTSRKRVAHSNLINFVQQKMSKQTLVQNATTAMVNRHTSAIPKIKQNTITSVNKQNDNCDMLSTLNIASKVNRNDPPKSGSLMLNATKTKEESKMVKITKKTAVQTAVKDAKRTDESNVNIPSVLQAEKSKLPVDVRNRYLLLLRKECTKLYKSKQAAYERALNEEFNSYMKCSLLSTYRNSVMLSINRLRKENKNEQTMNSVKSSPNTSEFDKNLYINLSKWILSTEELSVNGYPQPGAPKKGFALFKNKIYEQIPRNYQICARCKKTYKIDINTGHALIPDDCIYHPASRFRVGDEFRYACCGDTSSADGCCVWITHVFEVKDPLLLSGFVQTFEPEDSNDSRNTAVYGLDCEMVFTTQGIELARVTVINHKFKAVYERMVKPVGDILDCNTRYSGLTTKMLENATTGLVDVQSTLLLLFNSKTILIGHSLESDLKALRIIHSTVIDTSVLFPHKMGPPHKVALKTLASEYLNKIIQNDESGHDSVEDAVTCIELVIWKLKEKLKSRSRRKFN